MTDTFFLQKVKDLLQMHAHGLLGREIMPEDILIDSVQPKDLLNVLTLSMALNYQRNSYKLWESVVHAYNYVKTNWIFDPSIVVTKELGEIRDALLTHRVGLQPNRHPDIWKRVASGITNSSERGDVYGLIQSANADISILKEMMQVHRKSEFPYLSGPKIFNYWLYVIESYTDIVWTSRHLITIAPDTHILKASVKLGLCSKEVLNGREIDRNTVSSAWENVLSGSGLAPIDVHTPLWLWSRAGFPPIQSSIDTTSHSMYSKT
ncbi:hypothetical protein NSQ54_16900 [Alkalihalobacillus sp. FSL W8-0930]